MVALSSSSVWAQCQLQQLVAQDGIFNDSFGAAVAIDGDVAFIGAPGVQWDEPVFGSGAAYVFRRADGAWIEEAKLAGLDLDEGARFGASVAVDGAIAVVGAPGNRNFATDQFRSGSAFVFAFNGVTWTFQQKLGPPDFAELGDQFGQAVAMDGNTILVGRPGDDRTCPIGGGCADAGMVQVYTFDGSNWSFGQTLTSTRPGFESAFTHFGSALALDGDLAVVGAPATGSGSGSVFIFRRIGGTWQPEQELTEYLLGDFLGASVALHGDVILAGAPGDDSAGLDAGAAYAFVFNGSTWTEARKFVGTAPGDRFGAGVGLTEESAWVGAPGEDGRGAVHVFLRERNGTPVDPTDDYWTSERSLAPAAPSADADIGTACTTSGTTVLAGAPSEGCPSDPTRFCGTAYVFNAPVCVSVPTLDQVGLVVFAVGLMGACSGVLWYRRARRI